MQIWFALTFIILFAVIALLALAVNLRDWRWWALAIGTTAMAVTGTLLHGWTHTALTDGAALLAVGLVAVVNTPQARRATGIYLGSMAAAVLAIVAGLAITNLGTVLPGSSLGKLAVVLLLVGFAVKLALVPFYAWLPGVAEHAHPLSTALIVSIVDMAALNSLIELRETATWLFDGRYYPIWLALALLSMFGGAIMALAQKDIKRMLAFSTIDDLGYLILGVLVGPQVGLLGACLGALSHAMMKVLLFGSTAVVEYRLGRPLTMNERGLAARFPVAAVAFIVGALGMIGVPPTLGFVGRWRLYLSGAQQGTWLVLIMAAATVLALLYYVRAIHRVWLGQPDAAQPNGEPRLAAIVLIVLTIAAIAAGIYPGLWTVLLP